VGQVPFLLVKFKDPNDMANAFNNFLITITEKLNTKIQTGHAISVLTDSFLANLTSIKIIPITEAEKKKSVICSPKPKIS
jgi:hypothetical protein